MEGEWVLFWETSVWPSWQLPSFSRITAQDENTDGSVSKIEDGCIPFQFSYIGLFNFYVNSVNTVQTKTNTVVFTFVLQLLFVVVMVAVCFSLFVYSPNWDSSQKGLVLQESGCWGAVHPSGPTAARGGNSHLAYCLCCSARSWTWQGIPQNHQGCVLLLNHFSHSHSVGVSSKQSVLTQCSIQTCAGSTGWAVKSTLLLQHRLVALLVSGSASRRPGTDSNPATSLCAVCVVNCCHPVLLSASTMACRGFLP